MFLHNLGGQKRIIMRFYPLMLCESSQVNQKVQSEEHGPSAQCLDFCDLSLLPTDAQA